MNRKSRAVGGAMLALMMAGAASVRGGEACEGGPLAVVAQFLTLAPEQVQAVGQLLQEREQALAPIQQQIAMHEQQIAALLANGGDPAQIGQLMVEVHQLQGAAQGVQMQFLAGFRSVLNEPQRQRWAQVQMAAQLQPVVPAFQALRLF